MREQVNFLKLFALAIFLYLFFGAYNLQEMGSDNYIFFMNFLSVWIIYFSIFVFIREKVESVKVLIFCTFLVSLLFSSINILLFKDFSGEIFEFTGSDSVFYHETARYLARGEIFSRLDHFLNFTRWDYDDSGFLIYLAVIYKYFEEPLIARLFNILLNGASVYFLFRIASIFLPKNFAILSSLIFGISSFSIYYQSSGLKETLLIFIITLVFFSYYKVITFFKKKYLVIFITGLVSILLFRTVLVAFLIFTFGVPLYWKINKKYIKMFFGLFLMASVISFFYLYIENFERYFNAFNTETANREKQSASLFNQSAAILAGFFGPFPTIIPFGDNRDTVMHAPSLILKVFLSPYFIYLIYVAFKKKMRELYPLILFSLFHIISLSYIVHTFKLRNQFPHLPFFIICAVYGYYYLHNIENKKNKRILIGATNVFLVFIIFFWNYLRI